MKKSIFKFLSWMLVFGMLFQNTSCSSDESSSSAAPVIEKVSAAVDEDGNPTNLEPTNVGFANNVYVIQGKGFTGLQKVFFNDFEAAFNPTLVTDTTIFVTVPLTTPYQDQSNKLRIETVNGSAEYDFTIAPPAPQVTSINPVNAQTGDTVTVYGSFFINPEVTVGGTPATILTVAFDKITFTLPPNSQLKQVTVTTLSGDGTAPQVIGTGIYDDAPASFVENWLGPWDGSGFTASTAEKSQGESSIEANYGGYVGFKFPMFAAPASTAGFAGLRVSLKSTQETGKFKVVVNGNYGAGKEISFNNLGWTTFNIPWSEIGGNPGTINEIVFQEFNNGGGDKLYIDDLGFYQ
ncbi:IPT/TIG domain-containing protein [Flavobacterium sp.]|uniref:IPT/TIG domain-containing protein n=1 Tax=Flavobacterium sp. TaxID=239 RepID=UPI00261385E0|nr:IPT/TIG domain-containing protein [Flavobacterium sp.]